MNVQMSICILRTVTHLLIHMHQKKITSKIAAKIASVNRPLERYGKSIVRGRDVKHTLNSQCQL
jgi:hypothetical protein